MARKISIDALKERRDINRLIYFAPPASRSGTSERFINETRREIIGRHLHNNRVVSYFEVFSWFIC